jgi:hypothetical protein
MVFHKYKKTIYLTFIFFELFVIPTTSYASNNESSAGPVVALFQPDYGKFATITSSANQPTFPTSMLLVGGDATFMRKGFFTGGRVLYGSTTTSSISTSASTYELTNFGLKSGYGLDLSFIDLKFGALFGMGNLNFSSMNGSQSGSILVDYLYLEPFLMIGVSGGKSFKASMGAGYHYTFPYKVTTYGATLLSDPSQASISGVMITFILSFGDFGK